MVYSLSWVEKGTEKLSLLKLEMCRCKAETGASYQINAKGTVKSSRIVELGIAQQELCFS